MTNTVELLHWSTDAEAPNRRVDLYESMLSSALTPMQLSAPRDHSFVAKVSMAELGMLTFLEQQGSPHQCFQELRDIGRATEKSYHLILNIAAAWDITLDHGHHLEPGDVMLVDSSRPWRIHASRSYDFIHVKVADAWLRQWVPSPDALVGRCIGARSGWGRALATFTAQLSPGFVAHAPLPQSVIADQVGALLAFSAIELRGPLERPQASHRSLAARIEDCITQRSNEAGLTAVDVATSVGISVRTLHRCLSSQGQSFGALIVGARCAAGVRMLETPLLRRLTLGEISRRAGFSDPSHFARVIRARTGKSPSELRHGSEDEDGREEGV